MQLTDNMPHRSDPVVILFGNALFLIRALHTHTAELVDPEYFSVSGQAVLDKEYGATVIDLDGNTDHQHHGGCNDHSDYTDNDIKNTLDAALAGGKALIAEQQQGSIRDLDFLRTHNHNVRDLGNRIAADVIVEAILQNLIADIGRNVCHQNSAVLVNLGGQDIPVHIAGNTFAHIVLIFANLHFAQQIYRFPFSVNHQNGPGRIQFCKNPGDKNGPENHKHNICSSHVQDRGQILGKTPDTDQAQLQMGNGIDAQGRQNLRKDYFARLYLADLEASKGLHEEKADQRVQTDDNIVATEKVVQTGIGIPVEPCIGVNSRLKHHQDRRCPEAKYSFVLISVIHWKFPSIQRLKSYECIPFLFYPIYSSTVWFHFQYDISHIPIYFPMIFIFSCIKT